MTISYESGKITREVSAAVEPFRLVKLADGKVSHNDAGTAPYGAVVHKSVPAGTGIDSLVYGDRVMVITDAHIAKVETVDAIKDGADVFAAADGKVSAAGTVKVGVAHGDSTDKNFVRVHLFGLPIHKSQAAAA